MKLRNLILAVIAGAALLTGCNKEVDLGPAKLEVNPTDVAFAQPAIAAQDITLTATRDWAVTGLPDWIALSKESGSANTEAQTITLSVTENKGNNRSATLTFTIGFSRASITVSQVGPEGEVDNGDGTKEKPFNVAGVIDYVNELGADVTSPKNVYVAGKISAISEAYTTQYGNGSFVISDDGETTGLQFTAYRVLYLGNKKFASGDTQIEVGDDVIVYGKVVNYKGNTPETSQNAAFLYSLNGVNKGGDEGGSGGGEDVDPAGTGTEADPFNVAAAIAKAKETGETATSEVYYIKGKVASVSLSAQYKNGDLDLVDVDGGSVFKAYRIKGFGGADITGNEPIVVGDEVVICGNIVNFKGNTPETTQGGKLVTWNGKTSFDGGDTPGGETVDPKGTGTEADPFNVAAAIAKAVEAGETATTDSYYIKGKVAAVSLSAQYKNGDLDLVDVEGGSVFKAFRIKGFDGADITGEEPIKVGDEVVVYGQIVNYKGNTPETTQGGKLISWNGKTSFDGGDTPGGETGEAGSATNPFSVAQAIAKAVETGETATTDVFYIKGKVAAVSLSAQYKNADLDLIDEGNAEAIFKAFRIKGFDGADITGEEPIVVGDEVVVCGNIVNYKGNTPETTQGGKLVTWNGKTSFDGGDTPGGGDQPGGDVDFTKATTIKLNNESTWTEATDGTYKAGFETTSSNGIKVGVYKHASTSNIIAPDAYSARVYKSAVISISAPTGKKILGIRFKANDLNSGQYCKDLTVIEGGSGVISADATTFIIGDWTGSADRVVFQAAEAQTRLVEAYVVLDGEGGDTPGGDQPGGDQPEEPKLPVNDGLTEETAFTIQDAVYVAKNGTEDKEFFVKAVVGKDISIKNGTASFELVDGTTDAKLTVVKAKSFGGAEFDGTEPLEWLDEVVLKGKVTEYSTLPALLNAVFIKWNGKTGFKEPDPDFTTIAGLNALATATKTEYTGTLENAVISFVPNANNAIIKDATGSTLLYKTSHGLKQGQTFSGKTTVTVVLYQGAGELTAIDAAFTGDEAVVAPEETTLAALVADFGKWQSAYVKVSNLEVTGVSGKNVNVKDGDNTYVVFSSAGNATCAVGDKLTVTGTICQYNGTAQIKAWTLDAIEVKQYDFTSIASLNALATATATEYTGTLENAVVSFVPNAKNAIIKDATGSTLLFLNNHGLKQGQTFSGKTTVKVQLYQGAGELTAIDAAFTGDEAVVAPEETTLAALVADFGKWQSAYVKVSNLEVTGVSGKNVNVKDGDNTYVVFSNAGNATCAVGDKLTVTGTICQYNSVCQLKAWTLDAIEVMPEGDFTSIASLNALATSSTATEYTGKLTNAVVSFVPNAKNAIIKDATGSTLLYLNNHGLKQGQTFSGKTTVKVQLYQGAGELTAIDAAFTGDEAVVAPEETTLAALVADFGKWQSAYVKVSNLEVTGVSGKNVNVKDGDNTYVVFSNAGNATCAVGDKLTVTGTICQYNSVAQIKAWTLDAIEIVPAGGGDEPPAGGNDPIEFVFTSADPVTLSGVTVTCAKGEGSNNPAWNANYNELRLYVKNTVTISSTANMAKVEYYWHKQGSKTWNSVSMTSSEGTYTDCEASTSATDSKKSTWEGTSKSIVLTMGDTSSAQRVLEKVVVTLAQ